MIDRLIEEIKKNIKSEFDELTDGAVITGYINDAKKKVFPKIVLISEEFRTDPAPDNMATNNNEDGKSGALIDFRRKLIVDIYEANSNTAEKWASLIISLIIIKQQELINKANTKARANPHRSGSLEALEIIDRLYLVKGFLNADPDLKFRIEFDIAGRLKLSGTVERSLHKIKDVKIQIKE